jgi:hypothetical protein
MKYVTVGVAIVLILTLAHSARADGPDLGPWTLSQWKVIGLAYEYADHYGLTDADRDLFLGVLYRESHYGYDKTGDCYTLPNGNLYCLSIGVAMFHEAGVWASTPCARHAVYACIVVPPRRQAQARARRRGPHAEFVEHRHANTQTILAPIGPPIAIARLVVAVMTFTVEHPQEQVTVSIGQPVMVGVFISQANDLPL